MKKGQKVRILRTNEIATIADIELIRKGGKVYRYCHLKTEKKTDLWMDSSELGGVVEKIAVSVEDDRNRAVYLHIAHDHSTNRMNLKLSAKNPDNLKEVSGTYSQLMTLFVNSLRNTKEI
ncbi:hypothetical protein [uncultured Bacteroides sp.]|uniref:hypothetical protein n=1 Tax=uncultured Bacteroides sp. TaxID=162156 RepID=UPI0025FC0254|nr:hypothetical protein [uncultured Bacteroides sp.]